MLAHRTKKSSLRTVFGLLILASASASLPYVLGKTATHVDATGPLSNSAIRRGVFTNTGSRDVGPVSKMEESDEKK